MKKSTILLLVVVYILSFFLIGLLGHSIRNYNPEIYPTTIEVSEPDKKTTMSKDVKDESTGELLYDYYFVYLNYTNGSSVRIIADVKPDNTNWPEVTFTKDGTNNDFNIETHETNNSIEQNHAIITLNKTLDAGNSVLSAPFLVIATNPGTKIKLKVCITFVIAF